MCREIIESNGQHYLMNPLEFTFFEIVDYIITKNVILFSVATEVEEHDFFGRPYKSVKKKWGCANLQNKVIITCEYDSIEEMPHYLEGYIDSYYNGGTYFFDFDGTPLIILKNYELVRFEGWTKIRWKKFPIQKANVGEKNGLKGIINSRGDVILPPEYNSIYINEYDVIIVTKDECQQCILWLPDSNKWARIPPEFTYVDYSPFRKIYILRKDGLVGAINTNLKTVVPFMFDSIPSLRKQPKGLDCIVVERKTKKGLYDIRRKKLILPCVYDDIKDGYGQDFLKSNIIVVNNGKQGVFSIKDEEIIFPICITLDYSIYANSVGEDVVCCKKDYNNYFINVNGQVLFQISGYIRFTEAGGFHNGTVYIDFHDYSVVFDRKGNELKRSNFERNRRTRPSLGDYKADSWDAMTDGQYGDYSGDADYDALGF